MRFPSSAFGHLCLLGVLCGVLPAMAAQPGSGPSRLHAPFDELLDLNVRDGLVYYRALKSDRGRLGRYVASLDVPAATFDGWAREHQIAFWINAYNAFVLQTVTDHYPIRGRFAAYPANSIRQIPGAFSKIAHRAAGRVVTLDEIETAILPDFGDPRVYFALGRGALDSGRLRSESYSGATLDAQLSAVMAEVATRGRYVRVDDQGGLLRVSAIFGWRDAEFARASGSSDGGAEPFASRSPIERAILSLILAHLYASEREFLAKNTFEVEYLPFDWALNDLSGGRPD